MLDIPTRLYDVRIVLVTSGLFNGFSSVIMEDLVEFAQLLETQSEVADGFGGYKLERVC